MPRPQTKADLLSAAQTNYEKLMTQVASLTETELTTPFDFQVMKRKRKHTGIVIRISAMC